MAGKALKGLTVKIGGDTTELTKALDKVENQCIDLSSELGQINKLLKFDPKNTELLAQKQKVLAEAIGGAEDKLKTLKEAEKQVQEQFKKGEVSEAQVRALQREIIATEGNLKQYKKAAQETADAVEDLGKDVKDSAGDLDKQADSAEDAEDSIKSLGEGAENVARVGLLALAGAVAAVAAGIKSVVEETAEYRREMAKLDTAFVQNGHSTAVAYETYSDLQAVLGDTGQATEAANFIAILADNEQDLARWTEVCTGVYGAFGASLPIEGLVEAANESAKTGQITGSLADAINWAAQEGETFGVKLKQNIKFTKLSEKELSRMTEAQREEYEARKTQYEEIEEYNKTVAEATTAEEYFNIALKECSTEQERQALILETLEGKYSGAAETFREANSEVIAQNRASERLNAAWAEVGEKAAPIVTTFTEGVAELVEAFVELLEEVDIEGFTKSIESGFKKLKNQVLPALVDALQWVADNFDVLKSLALGFIAALAVHKITTFALKLGTTLVSALTKATAAQLAANAAANANPYILLASAIVAVATAIATYLNTELDNLQNQSYEAAQEVYGLSEAEQELTRRAQETGDAFRAQREQMDKSISGIVSQYSYLGALRDELLQLADADGKVADSNKARADFILTQLNDALGTEYKRVGDLIQGYNELKGSIDEVMLTKKNELLLEQGGTSYVEAVMRKSQAETDFYELVSTYTESRIEGQRLEERAQQLNAEKDETYTAWNLWNLTKRIQAHNGEVEAYKENAGTIEQSYNDTKEALEQYYIDIGQYETAQRLTLEGNTEEAQRVMSDREYYVEKYADKVGFESDEIMNHWELEATVAGIQAQAVRENWENGVEGYTEEMVIEAEKNYDLAIAAMENAYNDAYGVGKDVTDGIGEGMESGRIPLLGRIRSIISDIIAAARKESDANSPSRKMISLGEDMGDGAEIGLENTTDQVTAAAERQVQSVLDAYKGLRAPVGVQALEGISGAASTRQAAEQTSLASTNSPILERILTAIEKGQILTLDGDTIVGATAGKMDNALGRRRTLASRGAI